MLYKYPQLPFPYAWLVEENRRRNKNQPEIELMDTDAFDEDRYFDVFVEYAKVSADDMLMQITICNGGPEAAEIHVLAQAWFRNTWSCGYDDTKPVLRASRPGVIAIEHPTFGTYRLYVEAAAELLFTENETDSELLYAYPNETGFVKNAFHKAIVEGRMDRVNPNATGTKAQPITGRRCQPAGKARFGCACAAGSIRTRSAASRELSNRDGVRPMNSTRIFKTV